MSQSALWKQPFHHSRRRLAAAWYRLHSGKLTTIAITGSYGKTSTALAVAAVLSQGFKTLITDLNLDTVYNLPITLLKIKRDHQKLILELGVDHRGEMSSYLKIVNPQIAVITGITPVHSDPGLLGSLAGIIEEKGRLLSALTGGDIAILNADDEHVRKMAVLTRARIYWYSLKDATVDFFARDIKVTPEGTVFTLCYHDTNHAGRIAKIPFRTGQIGRHFVQSCLAAAAIGYLQGLPFTVIKKGLVGLRPQTGRVSLEKGPLGSLLINDSLRANPASTLAGLQVLADLPTKGKRVAVLGEMGELGEKAIESHRLIGTRVARLKIDRLVSVGPLQKHTAAGAVKAGMGKAQVFWVANVHEAASVLETILSPGDLLYLKGSLMRHMERVILLLNRRKVGCRVVSCHFYHQCRACPYLAKGIR